MSIKEGLSKAKTAADVGVFLIGASAGGLVDAALNSFGFAEPMVVAGLTGSAALGLKKLLWDAPRENNAEKTSDSEPDNGA